MRNRVLFAFAVAPLAATAVLMTWLAFSRQMPNLVFAFDVLWYAYITAGIFGVPAYLLTSSRNVHAPYGHALIGALIGLVPAGLLSRFTTHRSFIVGIVVASAVAGLVFGLIAGRNLTIVGGVRETR